MIQIINTIFIALFVVSFFNRSEKRRNNKMLKRIHVVIWCAVFFIYSTFADNVFTIFGPGVLLLFTSLVDYLRKKRSRSEVRM